MQQETNDLKSWPAVTPYDDHNYPPQDLEGVKANAGDTRGGQRNMGLTGPLKEGLLGYTNHKGIRGTPGEARCKAFRVPSGTRPE